MRRLRLFSGLLLTFTVLLAGCDRPSFPSPAPPTADVPLGDDDGYIETSISPFDEHLPAISRLDDRLREAVQAAADDAHGDGVEMYVTSGWRSQRYQAALLEDAVRDYGSYEEALKWVAQPQDSSHVTGDAIDLGPTDANSWLAQHGYEYGLCQTYANEMWHFELATEPGGECPAMLADASST